ncbi:MAG TPA: VIT domain-containing protein [Pyrinomonadaceae bacterium]|jgi:Ca-activated chloride channel family protein
MRRFSLLLVIFVFSTVFTLAQSAKVTEGSLYAVGKKGVELGACPLKQTKVRADISGFLTRVTVAQEFENNFGEPIEAVYTFPLSQNSAVDEMTMRIGERTIRGRVMKREEAQKVYEEARAQGKTASLLNQERPNIFTQAIANIMPGERIVIEISYVETLRYEDGVYEFVFPMTVGPRYIPNSVADAAKISPPVAQTRAGHDVSIEVNLDAGVPIEEIRSGSHEITTTNLSSNAAKIVLRNERAIPNKDFVLRYDVTGKRIENAILTHRDERGGFFSLILSPPENFSARDITPKEIVFVLDTSGSMNGFPIEKAKESMKLALDALNPQDTFNLITFAGDTAILFNEPVSATPANLYRAQEFLASRRGLGGTEMMKAVKAALAPTESQKHVRIVCFMTDGYVGNEAEIIAEIQKHENARVFSFGIGNSVNRFLLDKMAEAGRGEVEYVSLQDDGSRAARRFHERIRNPLLIDISIDWNGLPVTDVYPKRNGDLFSAKPLVVHGRYTKAASGTIRLRGKAAGQEFVREIAVNLPETESRNDVLAALWARKRVDELTREDYRNQKPEIREQITQIGLEFRLLTQFTSFVAVEEKIVNQNGQPTRVEVPVELPEGVNRATAWGSASGDPHGFITQAFVGRRTSRSAEMTNTPASVSKLTVTPNRKNDSGNGAARSNTLPPKIVSSESVAISQDDSSQITLDGSQIKNPSLVNVSDGEVVAEVFKRFEAHQKALTSLRADIKMIKYNSQLDETEVSDGVVSCFLEKGIPSVRIDWAKPSPEIFLFQRGNFLIYRPRLNSALTGKLDEATKNVLTNFVDVSGEKLRRDYSIRYLTGENVPGRTALPRLELTPKAKTNYSTIEIWIDASGMPIQMKINEKNGDWTSVLLFNPQKNAPLVAADFKLVLPKETKVIRR